MTIPTDRTRGRTGGMRGFSLVELMVSIAIGLIIIAAISLLFSTSVASRYEIDRTSRQIENGRYATELLRDDIQLAGFIGETNFAMVASLPAALPDPCATTLTERTFSAGGTPGAIRFHVQGVNDYDGAAPAPADLSCLSGANKVKPGTDVIVVRRAKTCIAGSAGCDALTNGRAYLQVPQCASPPTNSASLITTHALAPFPNATEFVHKLKDCTTDSPLRPYVIYLYFVGVDDTLKRAEFTGTAMGNVTPLVDGIENMQIDYGIDSNNDGKVDTYSADPGTPADWSNVVTVQINLLARNTEASMGYKDTKTYNLGASAGNVGPYNDKFRRHVYSTLIRVQNASQRRELP